MGVLERASHVVRADLNQLLRRSRDPQLVLEGYLEDLEAVLEEAESIRHSEQAEREGYAASLRDIKSVMRDMERKARLCLERRDEELARAALERKLDMQQEAAELEREIGQRDRTIQVLSDSIEGLKTRIEEVRPRLKDELGLSTLMQVPRITKITLNMGVGEAKTEAKALDGALEEVRRRRREMRFRQQLLQARSSLQQAIGRVGREENEPVLEEAADNLAELEGRLEAEETVRREGLENRVHSAEASARQRRRRQLVDQEVDRIRRQLGGEKEGKG